MYLYVSICTYIHKNVHLYLHILIYTAVIPIVRARFSGAAAELELVFPTSVKFIFLVSDMPIKCLIPAQPAWNVLN